MAGEHDVGWGRKVRHDHKQQTHGDKKKCESLSNTNCSRGPSEGFACMMI